MSIVSASEIQVHDPIHDTVRPDTVRPEIVDRLQAAELVGDDRPHEDVLVFTLHDGAQIPRHLLGERTEEVLARPEITRAYLRERDWGSNLVARELARELGLGGYLKINLARMVMDYGRFPGSSGAQVAYLQRSAIFPPFHGVLAEEAKHDVLRYYDEISASLTRRLGSKHVALAIHTYDPLNDSGTERPEVSLLSRLLEYQNDSTLPADVFDPLFPSILCESTCHRRLSYQALLDLEHGGYHSAHNYPYVMPVGSLEIRAQVWFFFRHLRRHFEARYPETAELLAYDLVWRMLSDVIRRSWEAELLRGYLHRYREAPLHEQQVFSEARVAYFRIRDFLDAHRGELVEEYRFSRERPSCLGIEVRKDLLCDLDGHGARLKPNAEYVARDLARRIAWAVRRFLDEQEPRPAAATRLEPMPA